MSNYDIVHTVSTSTIPPLEVLYMGSILVDYSFILILCSRQWFSTEPIFLLRMPEVEQSA